MNYQHVPIIELPAYHMDRDSVATLSYIFCGNIAFTSFVELYTYFMAGLPEDKRINEFWEEVEDLGWV